MSGKTLLMICFSLAQLALANGSIFDYIWPWSSSEPRHPYRNRPPYDRGPNFDNRLAPKTGYGQQSMMSRFLGLFSAPLMEQRFGFGTGEVELENVIGIALLLAGVSFFVTVIGPIAMGISMLGEGTSFTLTPLVSFPNPSPIERNALLKKAKVPISDDEYSESYETEEEEEDDDEDQSYYYHD